ncbi:MAG: membrane protein insertase YidC [Prevotellaceae bacterium]|jgi:YidC/Oxa1 family membrane protein insertase|nr:membrane protein insertase YidC [Prevotellaceae bacterium]
MNKNTLIGILLIGAIFIGYTYYISKEQKKQQEAQLEQLKERQRLQQEQDSIRLANWPDSLPAPVEQPAVVAPPVEQPVDERYSPALAAAVQDELQFLTIENNLLAVTFGNKGGQIYSVRLKNYRTHDGRPVVLFDGDRNNFSLNFFTHKNIEASAFYFTPVDVPPVTQLSETDSMARLTYRLQVADDASIDYIYTLRYDSYRVDLDIRLNGMNTQIPHNVNTVDLNWTATLLRQEKDYASEANYSTVSFKYPNDGDVDDLGERKDDANKKITTKVEWIAFKQQFFSSILIAPTYFNNASVAYQNSPDGNAGNELMRCAAAMQFPYDGTAQANIPLQFYFGPNHYKTLQSYGHDFGQLVPLGGWIIRPINRWLIIPTFDFLNGFIRNYGIIILLLTIFIKIILAPFSQKSIVSSAKMKLLKPDIDKINAKYPKQEDAMKKQQETMALYKKTGVSMMGGCLPMLLQMPILFAMFRFFPASFELRQEGFLWAPDFSTYDSIFDLPFSIPMYGDHVSLFALLMAVSTFFYSKMMMAQTPQTGQPGMKFMQLYFMPIFLLVLCNNFSSGLSYYYMLSNFITMIQTWVIRKFFIDEKKMLAKMQAHAAKPQKKSKFQQRLEDMQRRQQQQTRNRK